MGPVRRFFQFVPIRPGMGPRETGAHEGNVMIPSVLVRRASEMVLDYLWTTFNPSDDAFEERMFRFLDGPDGPCRGP